MARFEPIDFERARGRSKELMEQVQAEWGRVPNMIRTLAWSPAALEGYLGFHRALDGGVLPAALREKIAITVSECNGSRYCVAVHNAIGKTAGISEEALCDCRRGTSTDSRENAALHFARLVVENRGHLGDAEIARLREAGFVDEEIMEILCLVLLSIVDNYFNHVAETEIDFPAVPELVGT